MDDNNDLEFNEVNGSSNSFNVNLKCVTQPIPIQQIREAVSISSNVSQKPFLLYMLDPKIRDEIARLGNQFESWHRRVEPLLKNSTREMLISILFTKEQRLQMCNLIVTLQEESRKMTEAWSKAALRMQELRMPQMRKSILEYMSKIEITTLNINLLQIDKIPPGAIGNYQNSLLVKEPQREIVDNKHVILAKVENRLTRIENSIEEIKFMNFQTIKRNGYESERANQLIFQKEIYPIFTPPDIDWIDIRIIFFHPWFVEIYMVNVYEHRSYIQMGFRNHKAVPSKPNIYWVFFAGMALNDGRIDWSHNNLPSITDKKNIKNYVKELRKHLRAIFTEVKSDPFKEYRRVKGYESKFRLSWDKKALQDHGEEYWEFYKKNRKYFESNNPHI